MTAAVDDACGTGVVAPLVTGGCDLVEGAVVGAWLDDRLGALLWCGNWNAPRRRTHRITRREGALAASLDVADGKGGLIETKLTVQSFLRALDRVSCQVGKGFPELRDAAADACTQATRVDTDLRGLRLRLIAEFREALDAMEPFLATLDPRARRLCVAPEADVTAEDLYARLVGEDGVAALAEAWDAVPLLRRNARRASHVYRKELAAACATGSGAVADWLLSHRLRLGKRSESREASIRNLMPLLGAAPERWTTRTRSHLATERDDDLVTNLGITLEPYPPSWRPADLDGLAAFAACGPAVSYAGHRAPHGFAGAMANARGDWSGFATRLAAAHGREPLPHLLGLAVRDLDDVYGAYADQVLAPAVSVGGSTAPSRFHLVRVARNVIEHGRTMCRILDVSRRWHAEQARMRAALPPPSDAARRAVPTSWPRAWPDATYGGVTVVELTDRAALSAEGSPDPDADGVRGLDHCVGGYGGQCLDGSSRILSVRDVSGGLPVRLSTVQVREPTAGGAASVVQHRGHGNGLPPEAASAAVAAYVADLAAGRLVVDLGALRPVPMPDAVAARAGYDRTDPDARAAVRALWEPFLPRPMRGMTEAAVVARCRAAPGVEQQRGTWRPPERALAGLPEGERAPWRANELHTFDW